MLATLLSISSTHLLANTEAPAQLNEITESAHNSVFPASFFDQYTPQNAMEMVTKLPGFSFDPGSDERGFGGNAGNVLIDGSRPTSKSVSLRDALERIPASQVLHIEILRGGVSAGETAGQSIVANVIKKATETSGTWGAEVKRSSKGDIKPHIEATLTMKLGQWDTLFDGYIGGDPEYRTAYIEDYNADYELTSSATEAFTSNDEYIGINGEGSRKLGGGALTINASVNSNQWQGDITRDINSVSLTSNQAPDEIETLDEQEENLKAELGIDWAKMSNDWKLRVIGLASANDLDYENDYLLEPQNQQIDNNIETSQYSQSSLKTEYIARATYGKVGSEAFKPEFGFEIANNKLDTDISSVDNGTPEELEGADKIEELRTEIFANFVYVANTDLTLEGGLTAEFSNIKAYSDEVNSQKFNFLKPRLSANYSLSDDATINFSAQHNVEQLNFYDFAASTSVDDDRDTSGNSNLQPEQTTIFSVLYDWRFSERGSFDVEFYYELRKDIHEEIFLPSGNTGLGNAGDATFWGAIVNANLPIDAILENGLFEVFYTYKGSEFYDPIIEDNRVIYNYIPHFIKVDFRHDIPQYKFSWGLQFKGHYEKNKYYVDEIQKLTSNDRLTEIFIETTHFFNIKTRLEVRDVNNIHFTRTRNFYNEDRSGAFVGAEVAHRKREPEVILSFSGTF